MMLLLLLWHMIRETTRKYHLVLHGAFKIPLIVLLTPSSCLANARSWLGFMIALASHEKFKSLGKRSSLRDVFIIITCDSYLMFIYSLKHVRQLYFHHVMPVFHRRTIHREISSMNSPAGIFILDGTLLASELMMCTMPCWRVEHECLVSRMQLFSHLIWSFISAI